MNNPLIRKLEKFTKLSSGEMQVLEQVAAEGLRQLGTREDIIREGDRPQALNLILSGWACRYKHLEDGRRQIMAFFLPGDLCDNHVFVLREMDHSVGTLTPVTFAQIPRRRIDEITLSHPRVTQALWWASLVSTAIQREWTVSLGQRDALERMAHLLCELFVRLRVVGLTEENRCELPLTQAELADAMGLSTVHVNRTLQELRAAKLIILKGRTLTIPDLEALQSAAQFNPNYLHLEHEGQHLDAND
ncbi:Crp/Fnr family transcriptional regulator [Roseomonas xinghualingensis]|uniref:Crp/Fnr family transcriptional regulator n=1 Tax=Roseomonas xinghualingensis TaxID=2986475 RepID=UPI0021F1BD13|nr:Crp/Fnr family transcriptional regulator [Roseomonas sp. SXEYE001]MCV4208549.1 Crp/Fnr family transcriptional regulator [Roseomonas sp. SXEYE001]